MHRRSVLNRRFKKTALRNEGGFRYFSLCRHRETTAIINIPSGNSSEYVIISITLKDLKNLDQSQRYQVVKAIDKVSENPLPDSEGGYGKPLGSKSGKNLTGYLKIKLRKLGMRVVYLVVYLIVREEGIMKIMGRKGKK